MNGSFLAASPSRPRLFRRAAGFVVFAAGLCVLVTPAGARPPTPAPDPAATQELIFFTADGPVRVRVTVTLGGKPPAGPWQSALDALFAHRDRNGDKTLSAKEREGLQAPTRQAFIDVVAVNGSAIGWSQAPAISFPERDGKVDPAGFRTGFERAGLGPISVTPVAARGDSQALTDALFKHLDRDGDGKLSAAELTAARARLAALDGNEDEIVTTDELLGRPQNPGYQVIEVANLDLSSPYYGARPQSAPPLPDVLVPAVGQPITAKDLLAARDTNKDGTLSPAELGCDARAIADRDGDGDGRLDTAELAAWLRQPPDLDLALDLPARPGGSWLAAAHPRSRSVGAGTAKLAGRGRLADRAKPEGSGSVRVQLPSARIQFAVDAGSDADRQWQANAEPLRAAFVRVAGAAGVVERARFVENPDLVGAVNLFDFADRNADGKLSTEEFDRAVRTKAGLLNCRAVVEIADLGRGLFELLDRDGDGQLSPRELNAAPALLATLDRDGDGMLSRAEMPRGYTVTAKPASVDPAPAGVIYADVVQFVGGGRATRAVNPGRAPVWFRNADRNGDGDVSAREFPGPPALFKRIDTDGDGLISLEEALASDRLLPASPR